MVRVAAGPFVRGNEREPVNRDETPRRSVEVTAFAIDRTEVNVEAYLACVGAGACEGDRLDHEAVMGNERAGRDCNASRADRRAHPVNCVSWVDAYRYCAFVKKRLPTETEWEKAARGATDERQAPWGALDDVAKDGPRANLADHAARRAARSPERLVVFEALDDGFATTAPAGSFPLGASPYGALDMLGNVAEWVFDWYDQDAYFGASKRLSPAGPPTGRLRAYRGHAFNTVPSIVRVTRRAGALPTDRDASTGFRCARNIEEEGTHP